MSYKSLNLSIVILKISLELNLKKQAILRARLPKWDHWWIQYNSNPRTNKKSMNQGYLYIYSDLLAVAQGGETWVRVEVGSEKYV